jgi:predicted ATPase/DNA-binding winged helix-turn-helix (wHTH) protein/Tol biopolymer transport system component
MSSDLTSDLLQFNFKMPKGSKNGMYSFDRFKLDSEKLMLYRDNVEVTLPPKIVKTLTVLIEHRGSILSKDELIEKVWDDSIVEESNLSQNLYILRKTLGSKPDGGQYIETLRRRGYRFNAEVESHSRDERITKSAASTFPVSLIGRKKEIDEVTELLSRDEVRLVTISGVGGVGKTTLAKAVAERFRGEHEVFFVELGSITRAELVISMIASELGVRDSGDDSLLDSVKAALAGRSVLLVLDNFEQVVLAAPLLSDLAASNDDGLKILVTSRIALRIRSESIYVVPPLQIPEHLDSAAFPDIASFEAVGLYVERARQAQPTFELTPDNAMDVANICSQLGGLPLAIELAAARMRFMTPEALSKRLRKQLDFLQGAKRDAPQRQQTMRETIAWSFDLLTDIEKSVFARLGVFSGGFDLPAAEFVCTGLGGDSSTSVLNVITSLVEHNLLAARTAGNGNPRIYMLEVLREFAEEVLIENGEIDAARSSQAQYFAKLGEEAEPQLLAARSAEWLDRLETEHDNLRAALTWALTNDPMLGQRLAGAVWRFWWLHGHIREACEQLGSFLDTPNSDPNIRAKMLVGATFLNRLAGNSERSRVYAEDGVRLASSTGDLRTAALSFNQLGFLALDVGNFQEAERMFERGLKRAEELGDIQVLALLNNGLGELSRSRGDYQRAAEYYGRALQFNREAGDRVRQTTCLINLGATALMQHDRTSAGDFYRNGLEISSQMEDMNGTLYCLEGIAGSYWALHDPERASMIFGAAHAGRLKNNLLLEPADQVPYEESIALVRDAIGVSLFQDKFNKGGEVGLETAVSLALDRSVVPRESTVGTSNGKPEFLSHSENVVVERHGNVLRLVNLTSPQADHVSLPSSTEAIAGRQSSSWPKVLIAFASVIIAAVGYLLYSRVFETPVQPISEINISRLTNGIEPLGATISPDGKDFAYYESGFHYRLWLQQTGYSSRVEIIPASDKPICCTAFSPDSQFVYYLTTDPSGGTNSLYRAPKLGGTPARILSNIISKVSFSPDGNEIVYSRYDKQKDETQYVIKASDGSGNERIIHHSAGRYSSEPAWSPDGNSIIFARSSSGEDGNYVLTKLNVADETIQSVSDESWDICHRIVWGADGRGFYFIGTKKGDRLTARRDQLYYVSYPDGRSRRITTDPNSRLQVDSLGVTNDGSILTVPYNRASQIWAMNADGDSRSATQLTTGTSDGRAGIAPLANGRIAFIARSGDNTNIFVMNPDGSDQKELLAEPITPDEPRSSRGSPYMVFAIYDWPYSHLFRSNTDGSEITQITFGESREIDSSISNDGNWVAYGSLAVPVKEADISLWKVSINGGKPLQLKQNNCLMPHFSPDDKLLSCVEDQKIIHILSALDGTLIKSIPVTPLAWLNSGARWSPDGKSVAFIVTENGVSNIWLYPIDGSEPKPLTNFTTGSIYNFTYSTDGLRLFVARGQQISDAVLIKNSR